MTNSNTLMYYYSDFFEEHGDPRVAHLWLAGTPWPVVGICLLYLIFVTVLGPRLMRDREPFELFWFIRIYNLLMVAYNIFSLTSALILTNFSRDTFGCRQVDTSKNDTKSILIIYYGYLFLLSRLAEFIDTICFILRKKFRQVSAFHVFHHFSVPIAVWFFLKFAPGGNSGMFPLLNSFVHSVMYSYYFLATFEGAKRYLGWKKHLTQLQIIQFVILILHSLHPLFIPDCKFPKALLFIIIGFSIIFMYLFISFYIETYGRETMRLAKSVSRSVSEQVQSRVRGISFKRNSSPIDEVTKINTFKQIKKIKTHKAD